MMRSTKQLIGTISFVVLSFFAGAQQNPVVLEYINTYKELAIAEMQRTGVPASVKLAQGIHETMAGTSNLVIKSNNHFGIKCKSNWTGESVSHDDDARGECFRKYTSAEDSYRDHSDFLKNSQRYASLFLLEPTDYKGWANGLKKAGYATNPKYPIIIIKLIEDYQLQDYTLIALGKMERSTDIALSAKDPGKTTELVSERGTEPDQNVLAVSTKMIPVYPEGEFKINETKVIFVKQGTSYLSIAQQFNVPLAKLFEFNELKPLEATDTDQLLYLQRKRKTGKTDYHIVQPGETLRDIAQEEALRLESLLEYNWLSAGQQPAIGERLSLRVKAGAMPKLVLKENYSISPAATKWSRN
ncbi:MAG: glucosaminidase domain-containing protein [Chitinophagaceae bacterium]|jgi:LysM repeat protein|nr:glucosaminidase domain-containing protein [Chitinophagaceae bacterium]